MKLVFKLLRYTGLPFLCRELVQRNKVTIMMFHDITPQIARQSFRYLSRYYSIISMQEFQEALSSFQMQLKTAPDILSSIHLMFT